MKRKLLSMMLALCLTAGAAMCPDNVETVYAQDVSNDFNYDDYGEYIQINGYNGNESDIIIPSTIENKPVTSIGYFYDIEGKLTKITLPDCIYDIADGAFSKCTNLESIEISGQNPTFTADDGIIYNNGKTKIIACPAKKISLSIPNSVKEIANSAFSGCINLKSVSIPSSVLKIGPYAFSNCYGLTSIHIPDSVSEIGEGAFENCTELKNVIISNGVKIIGASAFNSCFRLTSVSIPNSIVSIGEHAFSDCSCLTDINIPKSVTSIEDSTFSNCSSLTDINIPSSVSYIHKKAFSGCKNLTSISIPNSVKEIEQYTFENCSGLKSIHIPESVADIEVSAFKGCQRLNSITVDSENESFKAVDGVLFNWNETKLILYPKDKTGNINIPNQVEEIGDYAFSDCSGLTGISIPNSVTDIGGHAFYNCYSLTNIHIPENITSIGLSTFLGCSGLTEIHIPENVTKIESYAFYNCSGLTNVNIPKNVTSIEEYTFSKCSGLTEIRIPNSVKTIEDFAFDGCSGLTDIHIPNSVTSIGRLAFRGCSGLTDIHIPSGVTEIGSFAFLECKNLNSITVDEGNTHYRSENGILFDHDKKTLIACPANKKGNINIPDSVNEIESNAFSYCSHLTAIHLPSNVTVIGDNVFQGCINLNSITVDSKNPSYISNDDGLLLSKNMKELILCPPAKTGNLNIPDGVKSFYDSAFADCAHLTEIHMPSSTSLNMISNAFSGCTSLSSITVDEGNCYYTSENGILYNKNKTCIIVYPTNKKGTADIPDNMTEIYYALNDCLSLESITVSDHNPVYSSENGILYNKAKTTLIKCPAGKTGTVTIPDSVTKIANHAFKNSNLDTLTMPVNVKEIDIDAIKDSASLKNINYTGTKEQLKKVKIDFSQVPYSNKEDIEFFSILFHCLADGSTITGKELYELKEQGDLDEDKPDNPNEIVIPNPPTPEPPIYQDPIINPAPPITVIPGDHTTIPVTPTNPATAPTTPAQPDPSSEQPADPSDSETPDHVLQTDTSGEQTDVLKTGTSCQSGKNIYRVTGSGTMAMVETSAKKKVTIPSTIRVNGKSYKITAIAANAFNGNQRLTKIVIGKNIKSIGKNAFKDCKNLMLVHIKTTQLKKVGKNAFKGINTNARIKLPVNKFRAYKKLIKNKGQEIGVRIVK